MPFTRLTFDVDGERQVSRAFELFEHEAADMSEPLGEIGELIRKAIGEEFETGGARGGAPWQPLSPDYARWKEAHYPGRPLLVASGDMRREMLSTKAFRTTAERLVYSPETASAEHPEIAGYHQRGADPNPARRMVDVLESDRRSFEREMHEWINAKRREHFGR